MNIDDIFQDQSVFLNHKENLKENQDTGAPEEKERILKEKKEIEEKERVLKEEDEIKRDAENKKARDTLEEQEKRESRKAGYKLTYNRIPKIYSNTVIRNPTNRK